MRHFDQFGIARGFDKPVIARQIAYAAIREHFITSFHFTDRPAKRACGFLGIGDDGDYYFNLDGYESTKRPAYVVASTGDISIGSDGSITFEGAASAEATKVKAGIIISKGKVTINSLDFWGMVIAVDGIKLEGTGKVRADYLDVRKLLQSSDIVIPYFSDNVGDKLDGAGSANGHVVIDFDNWKKD